MAANLACPDRPLLERFALGRMSPGETDALASHVEGCEACTRTLDELPACDTLVEALVGQTADPHLPRQLIERLKACEPPRPDSSDLRGILAPPEASDEIGRLGTYCVRGLLGTGGMGIVLLADDPNLRRPVALKIMKPAFAVSELARRRFVREAQSMAAVRHDNVAVIFAVGEDRGLPFFAMELLEGQTLADRLRSDPGLPIRDIIAIAIQIADGLAAAHERGVIHRDIKPGNLWIAQGTTPPRVKILDFGLAHGNDDMELTEAGCLLGTPAYMAPEQIDHRNIGPWTDLFSVGCVLYRMTAGRAPFPGDAERTRLRAVADQCPAAPHQVNHAVPRELSDLIMRLLARDPADRPRSARELGDSLRNIDTRLSRTSPKGRGMMIGAMALALLVIASVTFLLQTRSGTLVVKVPETGVKILVDGDEKIVLETSNFGTIELRPGPHRLAVQRGNDQVFVEQFVLKSGETTVIEATWQPAGKTSQKATQKATPLRTSPLDRVDAKNISADRRYAGQPAELVAVLGEKGDDNRALAFSTDGRWLLSVSRHDPSQARLWDLETARQTKVFDGPQGEMSAVAFGPGGHTFISGGADQKMLFWDVHSARAMRPYLGPGDCVYSVDFAPDGRSVLAGDRSGHALPGSVWWFDAATGKVKQQLKGHRYHVYPVLFFPDGLRALSGSHFADPTLRVWDLEPGKELRRFEMPGGVSAAAVAPDGQHIAGGARSVRVWDLGNDTDQPSHEWTDNIPLINALGFGPDSRTLTWIDTEGLVTRRDLASKKVLLQTKLPSRPRASAFAADYRHLAAGCVDGLIYLIRLESRLEPPPTR